MQIKIIFYKTSSKYYDQCCLQCEKFDEYISESKKNTVTITDEEIRSKRTLIENVLNTVKNWSKTEMYIDEKNATFIEIERTLNLLNCEQKKMEEIVGDHCYAFNGWGCNSLEEISFSEDEYSFYSRCKYHWYQFGYFENSIWMVDKEKIKKIITNEIERKHLSFCKYFDINRVFREVDKLPDTIKVDENSEECTWQYVYKDAPAGMIQTEIIGIKPKKEDNYYRGGFIINLDESKNGSNSDKEQEDFKNIPSTKFEDIGGMENIIQQVREVIELPMISPKIFEHYHLTPHKGILLYGPPGCGKSMIARAIANEINAHFVVVNGPEILNSYLGKSEENLRNIFIEAKMKSPSIIYFDEFDSISMRRDSNDHLSSSTVVNQLLTLMDGMDENKVCCIASTNRIDMIDEAIKRPGRFDYVIEIEKPSLEGCKSIFRIHTAKKPIVTGFDKDRFVEKYLVGLSGAEIAFVVAEAAYNSIRRTINLEKIFSGEDIVLSEENVIIDSDFLRAVTTLNERKTRAESAKFRYNL